MRAREAAAPTQCVQRDPAFEHNICGGAGDTPATTAAPDDHVGVQLAKLIAPCRLTGYDGCDMLARVRFRNLATSHWLQHSIAAHRYKGTQYMMALQEQQTSKQDSLVAKLLPGPLKRFVAEPPRLIVSLR